MVFGKTDQRKTLVNDRVSRVIFDSLFLVLTLSVCITCGLILSINVGDQPINETEFIVVEPTVPPEPVKELPTRIDFQPVVDQWVSSTSGNRSVIIYDVKRDEIVGSYNPDASYNTASLYKLFVVYEGYKRINSGEWDPGEIAGATQKTILECLDLAIRESYSPCAETLWNMIGREGLNQILENDYDIHNSTISSLLSNPNDILAIMKLFYKLPDSLNSDYATRLKDSFLNQPPTTYNWRQGLPSGFSSANVYDKVGWDYNPDGKYWNIYNEAAIVDFPDDDRTFIVVVMTNRVPYQKIRQLGSDIENHYLVSTKEL